MVLREQPAAPPPAQAQAQAQAQETQAQETQLGRDTQLEDGGVITLRFWLEIIAAQIQGVI